MDPGVSAPELEAVRFGTAKVGLLVADVPLELGESMFTSLSWLRPADDPRGKPKSGGGGVMREGLEPRRPLPEVSEKVSQKSLPLEFRRTCCLKLLDSPSPAAESSIIASSGMSSRLSRLGLERAVVPAESRRWVRGSMSMSDSRTCRTTSASRATSASTGADSSAKAARMRAKPFVFGCRHVSGGGHACRVCLVHVGEDGDSE